MKQKKITKNDVIELLIKKANGFYYTEEQVEFENKIKQKSDFQMNFFEDFETEKNANLSKNCANNAENTLNFSKNCEKIAKNELLNIDKNKSIKQSSKNILKNSVTVDLNLVESNDIMKLSSKNDFQNYDNLTLTKRKISNHYVPPDMIAIKILFEIFENKVDDNGIENMTDEELIFLKNQLLEELKNENIEDT